MRLVTVVAGIVVILDQAVKWIILHALPPGVPVTVIDSFFSLTLALVDRALAILWMTNALAWAKSTFAARLRDLNLGTRKLLSA